ncbi:hypothetical protein SAMN05216259_101529 [Actinacidiphila guanduensis]|uniref:Uncharacterized protein n=2 Tax=Actinacidiphila guanduensis TaxID=310781 RepID=A0A1G9W665_9ACTN|nr:hypothetical protein SAMN05216259_101529 [Actinacidiphila guanduensis]
MGVLREYCDRMGVLDRGDLTGLLGEFANRRRLERLRPGGLRSSDDSLYAAPAERFAVAEDRCPR